jgi:hypothetical protein
MENLPVYIHLIFILTTGVTLFIFYKASNGSMRSIWLLFAWLAIHMILSLYGFYKNTSQVPPRFLLLLFPPLLVITILFVTASGRKYLNSFNIKYLTLLHVVRLPVELVLLFLSFHKVVPELMTFEGRNFDIISGCTAPLIYYYGFVKKRLSSRILLLWNFICLVLLFNIVIHAILSAPFPFQQLAFNQPNIAVFYFPFVWLPGFIVPAVFFAHLVAIRKLVISQREVTGKTGLAPTGII